MIKQSQDKTISLKDAKDDTNNDDTTIDTSIFLDHIKQKFKGIISKITETGVLFFFLLSIYNINYSYITKGIRTKSLVYRS